MINAWRSLLESAHRLGLLMGLVGYGFLAAEAGFECLLIGDWQIRCLEFDRLLFFMVIFIVVIVL